MTNRVLSILVVTILFSLPHSFAPTWYVPGDAPTIQAGIDSAAVADTNAVIEGFTLTGGQAYDGGAIFYDNASPRIRNCDFI